MRRTWPRSWASCVGGCISKAAWRSWTPLNSYACTSTTRNTCRRPVCADHGLIDRASRAPARHLCDIYHRTRRHASQLSSLLEEATAQEATKGLPGSSEIHVLRLGGQHIPQVSRCSSLSRLFCPAQLTQFVKDSTGRRESSSDAWNSSAERRSWSHARLMSSSPKGKATYPSFPPPTDQLLQGRRQLCTMGG